MNAREHYEAMAREAAGENIDAAQEKWPVRVWPAGRGQWQFVAGPFSGTGYPSKASAQEAGAISREKAIARELARAGGAA